MSYWTDTPFKAFYLSTLYYKGPISRPYEWSFQRSVIRSFGRPNQKISKFLRLYINSCNFLAYRSCRTLVHQAFQVKSAGKTSCKKWEKANCIPIRPSLNFRIFFSHANKAKPAHKKPSVCRKSQVDIRNLHIYSCFN